ncbi:hypothetical protein PthstB1num2_21350 [Parageobacillus thermoglucosidasius]|nr:hypothetical protein PthstB1num2_21350 [Parageobacillus thermoglucosidasius]
MPCNHFAEDFVKPSKAKSRETPAMLRLPENKKCKPQPLSGIFRIVLNHGGLSYPLLTFVLHLPMEEKILGSTSIKAAKS